MPSLDSTGTRHTHGTQACIQAKTSAHIKILFKKKIRSTLLSGPCSTTLSTLGLEHQGRAGKGDQGSSSRRCRDPAGAEKLPCSSWAAECPTVKPLLVPQVPWSCFQPGQQRLLPSLAPDLNKQQHLRWGNQGTQDTTPTLTAECLSWGSSADRGWGRPAV